MTTSRRVEAGVEGAALAGNPGRVPAPPPASWLPRGGVWRTTRYPDPPCCCRDYCDRAGPRGRPCVIRSASAGPLGTEHRAADAEGAVCPCV